VVATVPYWQRLIVLLPTFVIGGGLILGLLILLGRAFVQTFNELGHKRLVLAGLGVICVAVVVLTYFGIELPKEE
jgi:hypothetical protein